jgi:SAM-dependent methyltransferase
VTPERGKAAWYERAFQASYLELYPHRDLESARAEVAALAARGLAGRGLDLACGFGRHVLAMRERGIVAFGLDLSRELLARAAVLGDDVLGGRLVRSDARALPFASRALDFVTLFFSSFGYFDDGGNERVLAEIARVLAPRGLALLDLMNPARVRATLVPFTRTQRDGRILEERRALADGGRRVRKDVLLVERDGSERRWHEDVRLYETDELELLFGRAALRLERVEGDFDGRPAAREAPRHVVWARR